MVSPESVGRQIDLGLAREWVHRRLSLGTPVARRLSDALGGFAWAVLLVPHTESAVEIVNLDDNGRGFRTREADAVAARLLFHLGQAGGQTLLVEHDLARRGDPAVREESFFVADRVVGWRELGSDPAAAAAFLRSGSSGYPLNAFISRLSPEELSLVPGREVGESDLDALVSSVLAVIVSVFDAETYVALVRS